jgi:hypothetical protein
MYLIGLKLLQHFYDLFPRGGALLITVADYFKGRVTCAVQHPQEQKSLRCIIQLIF